jgi:hypothetical protein
VLARRCGQVAAVAAAAAVIVSVPAAGAGPQAHQARTKTVQCRGGSNSCTARVSIAGGASNEKLVIELTDTDLALVSVKANRASLRGAYGLSEHRFALGGSEYVVTLNAVQSIPSGSFLTFTFRALS